MVLISAGCGVCYTFLWLRCVECDASKTVVVDFLRAGVGRRPADAMGGVPERLRERIANPLFVSSNLTVTFDLM